ncbi:flagellar hook associated protein [Agrobacterium sp. 33MFTa1.1]|uniref:flagellin N-terminal helical domain-containing protein n=1 Tax=Agrobacterium sp. 33MFTa1.1 TaxID=1279031 RepID=UPI00054D9C00|nr:flagellin [Agrobacterium sp. 33MFTa1.1]QBJ12109.1 flagellar hook associated protein [Agrobacterium sp. 33MFTa1.1]
MTSILTNVAAMAALQTLRAIGSNMEETQSRVSSGMRVKTASDNAAYWSIATTMRSDNGALSAVQDALGLGAAKVDTAYSAMETTVDVVKEISKKLVAAREAGVDKAKIQEEIRQLQDQLRSIGESASFSGENWLKGKISDASGNLTPVTKQIVGSFIRDGAGNVAVKTINIQIDNKTALFDTTTGATKNGILDSAAYYSDTGVLRDFEITTTTAAGVSTTIPYTAKVFTETQMKAFAPAGTTTVSPENPTTGLVTVASATSTNDNGTYFKIGENAAGEALYVKANNTAPTPNTVTAIGIGGSLSNNIYLETGTNAQMAQKLDYSLIDLDITEDLGGLTGANAQPLTENDGLDNMIQFVNTQLESLISASADLGSIKMRLDLQEDFVSKLTDSIDKGIGRLVDADMNEESTKLKALQTQQQLAIQSLSIANTSSENILSLFRQ